MKVLVTGGTGFVGGHVLDELTREGISVRAVHRGGRAVPAREGVEWVEVGALEALSVEDWMPLLEGIDAVAHLAARTQAVDGSEMESDAEFMAVNALPAERLAQAVAATGRAMRMVFVSSAHACRETSDEVLDGASSCAPESAYGRSKLKAERDVADALSAGPGEFVILRPSAVYGPGHMGNLARLLKLVEKGVPLPIGRIRNARSIVSVANVAFAVRRCLSEPSVAGKTYFVADAEPLSSAELSTALGVAMDKPAKIVPLPVPLLRAIGGAGDMMRKVTGRGIGIDSVVVRKISESLAVDGKALWTAVGAPPHDTAAGLKTLAGSA